MTKVKVYNVEDLLKAEVQVKAHMAGGHMIAAHMRNIPSRIDPEDKGFTVSWSHPGLSKWQDREGKEIKREHKYWTKDEAKAKAYKEKISKPAGVHGDRVAYHAKLSQFGSSNELKGYVVHDEKSGKSWRAYNKEAMKKILHGAEGEFKEIEKARTAGAKDLKPRRKRGALHFTLTANGFDKSPLKHPKVNFYHKTDTGELVLVNKKTGDWSHYSNEKGFTGQGSSQEDLRGHLAKKDIW